MEYALSPSQIASFWHLALKGYDRKEYGIEQLSSLVRALRAQAEAQGQTEEVEACFEMQRED